jgi:molybdopterin converting factor subunit 1
MTKSEQLQMVKIRLFASLREMVGSNEILLKIKEGDTVADLKESIFRRYPSLSSLKITLIYAVNHKIANDSTILSYQDEIAVFPPVSGGS